MRIALDLRPYPGQTRSARSMQLEWVIGCIGASPDWEFLLLLPEDEKDKTFPRSQTVYRKGPGTGWWENRIRIPRLIRDFKSDKLLCFTPSRLRVDLPIIHLGFDRPGEGISLKGWPEYASSLLPDSSRLEAQRERYTEGKPFFLVYPDSRSQADLSEILHAFSIFKKWTQSIYKLAIVVEKAGPLMDKVRFPSYKFRADVEWIEDDEELDRDALTGAALALILDPRASGYTWLAARAARMGVPVIGPWPLPFTCSFLETDTRLQKPLGEAMNRIYSSEGKWPLTEVDAEPAPGLYWEAFRRLVETGNA